MSRGWLFKSGEWHATCDVCGGKFWSSQMQKRWDGFMVCKADFEPRHPQDFLRARKDNIAIPWSRPKQEIISTDTVGWLERVAATDTGTIISIQYVLDILNEIVSVTEDVYIARWYNLIDNVTVSELLDIISILYKEFLDNVSTTDSGYVINLNYVDITYFEEEYVGEISTF